MSQPRSSSSGPSAGVLRATLARGTLLPWALAGLLMGTVVLLLHLSARTQDRALGRYRAAAAARLQANLLHAELNAVVSEARFMAEHPAVGQFLAGRLPATAIEDLFERFCIHLARYDQVRLLDLEGFEVVRIERYGDGVRTVPADELQAKRDRYYFRRALGLDRGELYVSRFDLNIEEARIQEPWKPVVRVAVPVAVVGDERDVAGIFVLNYLGAEILARLQRAAASSPSPTYLVDDDGFYLVGPDDTRSWGFMFGLAPTFTAEHPAAWRELQTGVEVISSGDGIFAQAPVEDPLPEGEGISDLRLRAVAHMPAAVLYASSNRLTLRVAAVATLVWVLLLVAFARVAHARALQRSHERELERSRGNLRRLSARLLEAQEHERRRLSRDLHDEVGQLATAVTIQLKRARQCEDASERTRLIEASLDGTTELLEAMHRIASSLRAGVFDDVGLDTAIRAFVEPLSNDSSLTIRLELEAGDGTLDEQLGIHALRIVQEAVTNALRHAEASTVTVCSWIEGESLHLAIEDDGCGFAVDEAQEDRLGLVGMRERVELLDGELRVASRPGAGTRVRVSLPLDRGARGSVPLE